MNTNRQLPKGFFSAGLSCGLKASGKKDLGIIFSENPCEAAGVFTKNSVKAHCVTDNQAALSDGYPIRAIVVNSGNANACTGEAGLEAVQQVTGGISAVFGIPVDSILTASTGVIGVPLPYEKLLLQFPELKKALSSDYSDFAEAILTTDLVPKTAIRKIGNASVIGITKGSGMIHPNMATMLAFVITDLKIDKNTLERCLSEATDNSFNQISVDGDTSTNDMVLLLANGASEESVSEAEFKKILTELCQELAIQIVKDGEGATKVFEVKVRGLSDAEKMRAAARGVVSSSLVKSAIFGNDPNWGRILAAAGQYCEFDLNQANLKIFNTQLLQNGQVCNFDKAQLSKELANSKFIKIDLMLGDKLSEEALAWGCDLTYDYVKINAEYTT